jgi:hypothetical protein
MNNAKSAHEISGLKNCLVDGFKFRIECPEYNKRCYFLTHYHSDHYGGLSSGWKHGKIYCTPTTGNLLSNVLHINREHLITVEIGESVTIQGAKVSFLDANHCPGAALLLFELENGINHLHTGDMRFTPSMMTYPQFQPPMKIDKLYLDTTYAHPKHQFMPQSESIALVVSMATEFLAANPTNGIIYISAYNLGKERIIFALADALPQYPIFLDGHKMLIMEQLLGARSGRERVAAGQFTSDPYISRIHVTQMGFVGTVFPFFKPNFPAIQEHMCTLNAFNSSSSSSSSKSSPQGHSQVLTTALAFMPTGWADSGAFNRNHSCMNSAQCEDAAVAKSPLRVAVQLVPYSEHSQCKELLQFAAFLRPREVVPTVFSDVSECCCLGCLTF